MYCKHCHTSIYWHLGWWTHNCTHLVPCIRQHKDSKITVAEPDPDPVLNMWPVNLVELFT